MRTLALLAVLTACGPADTETDGDTDPAEEAAVDRAWRWLQGTFDSSEQAASDAEYLAVRMVLCPATVRDLGERVLYLEQAAMDSLDRPYRQRLYVVEEGETPDTVVSRIFTVPNATSAVGACDDPDRLPTGVGSVERAGCAVTLTWDGARFTGGTTGTDCPTSLGGDYATSEVTLEADRLTSWDRGFFDDGSQAWGVTGGPYVFLRRTPVPEP